MITNYSTKKLIRSGLFVLMLFYAPEALAGVIGRAPNNLGLVGYWSFNDATSTTRSTLVQDFSGNNNNGVMTNMANPATAASGVATGRLGKAFNFDGSDDYVDVPDAAFNFNGNYTVAAWVRPSAFAAGRTDIVSKNIGTSVNIFLMEAPSSGAIRHLLRNSAGDVFDYTTSASIPLNSWSLVVVTYNTSGSANAKTYINGVQDATTANATALATLTGTTINIGRLNLVGEFRYWNGLIDEVRIYNRALSAAEISALYKTGAAKFTPPSNLGLVGYWSFNDATSTTRSTLVQDFPVREITE